MAEEIISKHVEFFLAAGWNQLVPQKVKQPFACVVEPGEDNYSRGAENAKICGNVSSSVGNQHLGYPCNSPEGACSINAVPGMYEFGAVGQLLLRIHIYINVYAHMYAHVPHVLQQGELSNLTMCRIARWLWVQPRDTSQSLSMDGRLGMPSHHGLA